MNSPPAIALPAAEPPPVAGTYALLLTCRQAQLLQIGRRGALQVEPGCYVYVGSAFGPGGLRSRIAHHLRLTDRPHWHLDYLRQATIPRAVWYCTAAHRQEHLWARLLAGSRGAHVPMPGFGASDCRCAAHLFFFRDSPSFDGFCRRLRRAAPGLPGVCRTLLQP